MKEPILLTVALLVLGSACENESIDSQSPDSCQDYFELEIQESCTFAPSRRTIEVFKDAKGFIEIVELTSTKSVTIIRPDFKSNKIPTRVVVPCNFLSYNFKEGQELIFSGNLKETFATENIIGSPIELTGLKIRCSE